MSCVLNARFSCSEDVEHDSDHVHVATCHHLIILSPKQIKSFEQNVDDERTTTKVVSILDGSQMYSARSRAGSLSRWCRKVTCARDVQNVTVSPLTRADSVHV